MTLPRQVLPGQSYMVTRRCTQRQFLMRPDDETNRAFEYCLAVAAERFGIELLFTIAMSNHHHTGIFDREGRYPEFLEYFHKLFAKCQNALRGRWENFWSSEQTSMVRLATNEDVLEKLVYAVTNPVKEHLVERAFEWPGVSSYEANRTGRERVVKRPAHFFRSDGAMPEEATLRFVRPKGYEALSQEEWARRLGAKVRDVEFAAAEERRYRRTQVLGKVGVRRQHWASRPRRREERRGLSPRVAAQHSWRRVEALARDRRFVKAYRLAREALTAGYSYLMFPEGTYWLMRFVGVVGETVPLLDLVP